jgi:hypothetical protein
MNEFCVLQLNVQTLICRAIHKSYVYFLPLTNTGFLLYLTLPTLPKYHLKPVPYIHIQVIHLPQLDNSDRQGPCQSRLLLFCIGPP